ncbi:MAG TPA: hypothetical protein DHV26_12070 [Cytophagales bacterium]|nr:hypothetical protein [Cytophagales bacterium]HRG08250.1 hypothetical protein [Cyclobacteriaceae bacterium]
MKWSINPIAVHYEHAAYFNFLYSMFKSVWALACASKFRNTNTSVFLVEKHKKLPISDKICNIFVDTG